MFYDDLLAMKQRLELALMQIGESDENMMQKRRQRLEIIKRLYLIENELAEMRANHYHYPKIYDQQLVRKFKKEVKYEFLKQAQLGYFYQDILSFLLMYYQNPGINIEKFIAKLRYDEKRGTGYYFCEENTGKVYLNDKAVRYLENEANVSLKA